MILAVDPGEKHCGMAWWDSGVITDTRTVAPDMCVDTVHTLFARRAIDVLVCERYALYPWLLQQQGFSEVRTVEVIGVLRYLCRVHDVPFVVQNATIKKPTFAIIKKRGTELTGLTQHERDAEAHAWHYHLNGAH